MTHKLRNMFIISALVFGTAAVYDFVFGCHHKRYSWPITRPNTRKLESYVVCLECGKEFTYDWNQMKVKGYRHGASN